MTSSRRGALSIFPIRITSLFLTTLSAIVVGISLIVIALAPLATQAAGNVEKTNPTKSGESINKSKYFLENQIKQLSLDQQKSKTGIERVNSLINRVKNLEREIKQDKPEQNNLTSIIDKFKSDFGALDDFVKRDGSQVINQNTAEYLNLEKSYQEFSRLIGDNRYGYFYDTFYSLLGRSNTNSNIAYSSDENTLRELFQSVQRQHNERRLDPLSRVLNVVRDLLYEQVSRTGNTHVSQLSETISQNIGLVSSLNEKVVEDSLEQDKSSLVNMVKAFGASLSVEKIRRQGVLKEVDSTLNDTYIKLDDLEKNEITTEKGLIYAVYMMIGAILFMFIFLRSFNDKTATKIIDKRALVELVGISFLLITIIILGTGNKIDTSALAALLGTIAGYVFGKGVGKSGE